MVRYSCIRAGYTRLRRVRLRHYRCAVSHPRIYVVRAVHSSEERGEDSRPMAHVPDLSAQERPGLKAYILDVEIP
jgi:hypothetical protein